MAHIFISHVEPEQHLATALEGFLHKVLGYEETPVFLSSNVFAMAPGEQFEERIKKEINSCKVFLMMCSNQSFTSHWIHVEAGAAWAAGKPIIPVCYCGKTRGTLPRPYSSFHAMDLEDAYKLVVGVAQALKLPQPPPGPRRRTLSIGPSWMADGYSNLYEELTQLELENVQRRRRRKGKTDRT